ncbi:MAG: hypothetical protein WA323_19725 [Candidatus Nitrosopolaris sp.]
MSEETKSIELIDDKPSYVSFRISSEEFKQMECFAKFLHKQGVIKAATVPCLARSILFTEINKFAKYLQEVQLAVIEQKRQEDATRAYNDKIKNYYPNLPPMPPLKPLRNNSL